MEPRSLALQADSLLSEPPGKLRYEYLMVPYCHQEKTQTPSSSHKALHKPPPFPDPSSHHFHPLSFPSSHKGFSSCSSKIPGTILPRGFCTSCSLSLECCSLASHSGLSTNISSLERPFLATHLNNIHPPTPPCYSQTLHLVFSLALLALSKFCFDMSVFLCGLFHSFFSLTLPCWDRTCLSACRIWHTVSTQ